MKYLFLACMIALSGCNQKQLSERDKSLQDRQQQRDLKKAELTPIAGTYAGELSGPNGYKQNVMLMLEVRDVAEGNDSTDTVLVPKLLGNLRFYFGRADVAEFIDAPIRSSEYVKASKQITMVVEHAQFREMSITGLADGQSVEGQWSAPSLGAGGGVKTRRVER